MTTHLSSRRRPYGAVALAIVLAAALAACAQAPGTTLDDGAGSGSSVPGQIDYHGFPYNIQAG